MGVVVGHHLNRPAHFKVIGEIAGDDGQDIGLGGGQPLVAVTGLGNLLADPHRGGGIYHPDQFAGKLGLVAVKDHHRQVVGCLGLEDGPQQKPAHQGQDDQEQQVDRLGGDPPDLPVHDRPEAGPALFGRLRLFNGSGHNPMASRGTITLMPGRNPSTGFTGLALTSKVFRSKPPEELVARQVAKSPKGEI